MNSVQRPFDGKWLLLAILGTFGLRLAVVEYVLRGQRQLPDTILYVAYAQSLYRWDSYAVGMDGARRAPGYPSFLALAWWLTGCDPLEKDPLEDRGCQRRVLWIQAALSTATCWFVFQIATRLAERNVFPPGSPWCALAAAALDPYANVLTGMLLSETVFTCLIVFAVWWGLRLNEAVRLAWLQLLLLGAVVGVAVLVRPSSLLLAPAAAACWLWFGGNAKRLRLAALVAVGCVLMMTPWTVRNAFRYGKFVPTTLNVGESLYDGWNPEATGASNMEFLETEQTADLSEVQRDRYWWDHAWEWAKGHPVRVLELAWIKFLRFWSPWPNEAQFRRAIVMTGTTAVMIPVFGALLLGTWMCRRHVWLLCFCWMPAVYFCGLHMVFVSSVRYRVPAMPFLDLLAGAGVVWACTWWLQRKQPPSVSTGLAAG